MQLKFVYAIFLTATAILASCNSVETPVTTPVSTKASPSPETPHAATNDGVRRITTSDLEKMIKDGTAFVVDVRNQDSYDMGHIPGAHLIPAGEVANRLKELPRDKTIVTYCS